MGRKLSNSLNAYELEEANVFHSFVQAACREPKVVKTKLFALAIDEVCHVAVGSD